jgi:apolipoprotein N-acyltransferase
LAGVALTLASLFPETLGSTFAAVISALLFYVVARSSKAVSRDFFFGGLVFSFLSFYWLPDTIILFGGLPAWLAYLIFCLFSATSALQFFLVAYLYRRLDKTIVSSFYLSLPIAWLAAELVVPRLFPWAISHALVSVPQLSALGEYVGVPLLSAFMIWLAAMLFECGCAFRSREGRGVRLLTTLCLSLVCAFGLGLYGNSRVAGRIDSAEKIRVALIQGNLDVFEKSNIASLSSNVERYRVLSKQAVDAGAALVFWPETVLNDWLPISLDKIGGTRFDPLRGLEAPLLYGGLSFAHRDPQEVEEYIKEHPSMGEHPYRRMLESMRYNSAIGVGAKGERLGLYHKQVLMPFGETIPFSDMFPWLKTVLPFTGDFSRGDIYDPIVFPKIRSASGKSLDIALGVLICYEDLIPSLTRDYVARGANLLVNLTNDAWYGDTAAPHQHHLLAQWRAIESRRYMIRVTNTGLTAVVDPYGRTTQKLGLFEEGALVEDVAVLSGDTLYSRIGDVPAWLIVLSSMLLCLRNWFVRRSAE